ncbi:MAG: META domain-containing protein [Pseudomonadota bacterium]
MGFRIALFALALSACTSIAADERAFEGTRWHVSAIDGRSTPPIGDYRLDFAHREISGRFGCNGFGGSYAVIGDIMSTGEIRSTLMGCPEPAASFESQAFAVLRLPMQMRWTTARQLTLSNNAGSIELQRQPR